MCVSHPKRNEAKRRPVAEATAHAQRSLAIPFARPKFLCVSTEAGNGSHKMASLLTEAKRKSHKMASLTYCESTKFRLLFGKTQIVCDFCLVALCWVILLIKYISLPNASVRESQLQSYDRKLQLDGLNFFCFPFFLVTLFFTALSRLAVPFPRTVWVAENEF